HRSQTGKTIKQNSEKAEIKKNNVICQRVTAYQSVDIRVGKHGIMDEESQQSPDRNTLGKSHPQVGSLWMTCQ
ncbi:MAG: hypothetical protein ACRD63_15500, partial [Pyrinomonadaceae bacterium]